MYILGVNGWHILSHDPSACLVKNGKILAMAEEERFIRQKHAFGKIPINATGYCLSEANINLDNVSIIAIGWDYKKKYKLRGMEWDHTKNEVLDILFPKTIFSYNKRPKLVIVPHHFAHAASVFFTSGFKEATILVVDGKGEDSSTTIWYGNERKIKLLKSFSIPNSLGYFYESVNKYIGFDYLDSGKTMGLAPYGKSVFNFENIKLTKDGYNIELPRVSKYEKYQLHEPKLLVNLWNKELYKGGANLRINTLITRPLFKEAEGLCELASKYCTEINFFNTRLIGRARKYLFDKILSFDELARFNNYMDTITPKYPNLNILYRETVTTYNSIKEHNRLGLNWGRCPAGLTRFVLISNGDLYGCGYFPYLNSEGLKLGNIKEEGYTILNVWRYSSKLKSFRELNKKRTLECFKCPAYSAKCPGMCIADELNRKNLPGGINPYCSKKFKINF